MRLMGIPIFDADQEHEDYSAEPVNATAGEPVQQMQGSIKRCMRRCCCCAPQEGNMVQEA